MCSRRRPNARIPLGIADDQVELGSHLIHFWENDEEFARGVRFLEPGLSGNDHCVVFGNDEVTARVFRQLDARGFDTASLLDQRQNYPASPGVFRLYYTVRYRGHFRRGGPSRNTRHPLSRQP